MSNSVKDTWLHPDLIPMIGFLPIESLQKATAIKKICPFCNETCGSVYRLIHDRLGTPDYPICKDMCGKCIDMFYDLHKRKEDELFACPFCQKMIYEWEILDP